MADLTRHTDRTPHGWLCSVCLTVLLSSASCFSAHRREIVFETDFTRLVLDPNASIQGLVNRKTAEDWLAVPSGPFARVKKGGEYFPATQLTQIGELWRVDFGDAQVRVDLRISEQPEYLVFEVVHVHSPGVDELRFAELSVRCRENAGGWLGVRWNERFAVSLLGMSDRVRVQLLDTAGLAVSVYPEFGMEGEGAVLVAAPSSQLLDVIQKVERECGMPSPQLGGEWAKTSKTVRTSYLFTDLTRANVDETIRLAKLGGFECILIYAGTWSASCGPYDVHVGNFPEGEASLKEVVDKCHEAGLKVGLHVNTSMVDKSSPLVQAELGARLVKEGPATLALDIDKNTTRIVVREPLGRFQPQGDIQIDDELIRYHDIDTGDTTVLSDSVRGFAGTRPASHRAGTKIYQLVERYGHYLADLRTTLKDEVSGRIAGVINACGFDMVYFDGGEANAANGPDWYWVTQQQDDICQRVTRELLVQGSGYTPWLWHWFARGNCDDYAAVASKQYLDQHKIADSWTYFTQNFMPAELGWWGLLADELGHPATRPDEAEYYALRMLALDTPVSLETELSALKQNGRAEEMFRLLRKCEELRLSGIVPNAIRERLLTGEWHLSDAQDRPAFFPIRYDTQRVDVPGTLTVTNTFDTQPVKFRLQAVPRLATAGDERNVRLLHAGPAMELPFPEMGAAMPGALARRTTFAKPLDLSRHRGLAIRLQIDGPITVAGRAHPVLNVQLEAQDGRYRDHYVDLDFTGVQTLIIPEPTTERMLAEFRPDPRNYAFKAAMYHFDYHNITALNLRWMRSSVAGSTRCRVLLVEALAESDITLTHPTLTIGSRMLAVPADLRVGDYAEFWASGALKVFDRNGNLLASLAMQDELPVLEKGVNFVAIDAEEAASAKLTAISMGTGLQW